MRRSPFNLAPGPGPPGLWGNSVLTPARPSRSPLPSQFPARRARFRPASAPLGSLTETRPAQAVAAACAHSRCSAIQSP